MLIDTQVSIWDETVGLYENAEPWEGVERAEWWRSVSLDEIDDEMCAAGVTGVALMAVAGTREHTEFLLEAAETATRPTRVIAILPLDEPDVLTEVLPTYVRRGLVSARWRLVEREGADPALLERIHRGVDLVADHGLALDLSADPPGRLGLIPRLARSHPDLPIIINLLGSPAVGRGEMQPWTDHLAAAAAFPHVHIKVASLFRVAPGTGPRFWQPYTATALDLFGAERIMIASDWPAVRNFGRSYRESIEAVQRAFTDLTAHEQQQVCFRTAARIYGFPID